VISTFRVAWGNKIPCDKRREKIMVMNGFIKDQSLSLDLNK
jgi:hypothetical protein